MVVSNDTPGKFLLVDDESSVLKTRDSETKEHRISFENAKRIIIANTGVQFCPGVVDALNSISEREIYLKWGCT